MTTATRGFVVAGDGGIDARATDRVVVVVMHRICPNPRLIEVRRESLGHGFPHPWSGASDHARETSLTTGTRPRVKRVVMRIRTEDGGVLTR